MNQRQQDVVDGYLIAKGLDLSPEERVMLHQDLEERIAKAAQDRKTIAKLRLVLSAESIRKAGQTHAQAVLAALEHDPELYQP